MKKAHSTLITASRILGKLLLTLFVMLPRPDKIFAQAPALEFNVNGHPAANGPTVAAQTVTFQNNTLNPSNNNAFAVYTPPLTATFDFTYQRFTPGGIGNAYGLRFGYNAGASNVYPRMDLGTPGAASSANYTSVLPANSGGIATNINYGIEIQASSIPLQNAGTGSGRQIMGTLRIVFNRPVTNPILHLENLGAYNQNTLGIIRYYSAEFDVTIPAGATVTELDGNNHFVAAGAQILNGNNVDPDATDAGSANGSVMINGVNITEIRLNVFLQGTAGGQWASTTTAGDGFIIGISLPTPIQLSGNVFNDANGLSDNTVNGTGIGTASGSQMYVNLFTSTGVFVAATPVAADGTYSFPEVAPSASYIAMISPTAGSPLSTVPAGWVFTGENMGTGPGADGIVDGQWHFTAGIANLANINFGIERIPTANPVSQNYVTPSGTGTVVVPTLTGSDPEDGAYPGTGGGDTIVIETLPLGGTLYYNGIPVTAGQVINGYNPALLKFDPPGSGSFSFTFRERDAAGISSVPATVMLNFDAMPIAVNDLDTTAVNVPATGDVSSNDTCGADGGCMFNSIGTPLHGVVTLNTTGTYIYTPTAGFSGVDSFRYTVCDADGDCDTAVVRIFVDGPPVAVNDTDTTAINTPASGSVSSNDQCGNPVCAFSSIGTPPNGTVTLNSTGMYTYTPATGFTGVDSFRYTICDADGDCDTAVVTIYVTAVPIAIDDNVTTPINTPVNDNVSSNDACSTAACTFAGISTPAHGTLVLNPTGTYTYTPNTNFSGTDSFRYTICNELPVCDTAWVYITIGNLLPVNLISFTVKEQGNCALELQWQTGAEEQFRRFEVEMSRDAGRYELIRMEEARGSGSLYTYLYNNAGSGRHYFRLKMVDLDHRFKYSKVVIADADCQAAGNIVIYPVPTSNMLHITGVQKRMQVSVFDINGKRISEAEATGTEMSIDMTRQAPGIYHIAITTEQGMVNHYKVIKR